MAVATPDSDLRTLYDAHAGELFAFALRTLGERGAAEDLVQDVFLRAWLRAETYRPERGPARGWLFAIARNLAIDTARARSARPQLAAERVDETGSRDSEFEQIEQRIVLAEALGRLTPDHRRALVEVAIRERTVSEAAAVLGVPPGTVKSRVFYALKALRLGLEELGFGAEE
ncbi:sigma70-ECF: RNA polymerase sigma factor, sigma-70 family [Gaiella occulta]|uniref:Sigma70-ECF: RNA polymerase sigma factor, sigma-70 family n=1 Tax=Gaiella occulta TaxID=1002870 RepID=A0A7M2Z0N3_9ACTN|nr:sigma-70 family RNA polymerase sigma factor [Gaiella occulta]RDI75867.1 sigma70-ECF: RNA polymerase sigma factor, sigma-70 family [Gaiella occulta]